MEGKQASPRIGRLAAGTLDSICDVPGVTVGHVTVTAIPCDESTREVRSDHDHDPLLGERVVNSDVYSPHSRLIDPVQTGGERHGQHVACSEDLVAPSGSGRVMTSVLERREQDQRLTLSGRLTLKLVAHGHQEALGGH